MKKRLPFEYYLEDIPEEEKLQKQQHELEWILGSMYLPHIGIVIDSTYIKDDVRKTDNTKLQFLSRNNQFTSLFVTIITYFKRYEDEDIFSNYRVKFQISETNIIEDVPVRAIKNWWRAGWPRDGKDPRYFTDYPWKILKPMHMYLRYLISLEQLKAEVYKEHIYGWNFFKDYYASTLPKILDANIDDEKFRDFISAKFFEYFQENVKEIFYSHRNSISGYIYTGVIFSGVTEAWFYPDTIENNPFVGLALFARQDMINRWSIERELREKANK